MATGLLVMIAGCGSAPTPTSTRAVDRVTSGPGTGDLLLSGLVRAGGSPVPNAGADLVLWPADLDEGEEGDFVDTFRTSRVRTDADGRFALRLDPDRIPSKYLPAGRDFVNFDVEVWQGRTLTMASSTVSLLPEPRVWRTDGSRPGDPVASGVFDLTSHRVVFTSSTGEAEKQILLIGELPEGATRPG